MLKDLITGFTLILGTLKLLGMNDTSWMVILSMPASFLLLAFVAGVLHHVMNKEEEEKVDNEPRENKDLH